jgi:hypothetical protein
MLTLSNGELLMVQIPEKRTTREVSQATRDKASEYIDGHITQKQCHRDKVRKRVVEMKGII